MCDFLKTLPQSDKIKNVVDPIIQQIETLTPEAHESWTTLLEKLMRQSILAYGEHMRLLGNALQSTRLYLLRTIANHSSIAPQDSWTLQKTIRREIQILEEEIRRYNDTNYTVDLEIKLSARGGQTLLSSSLLEDSIQAKVMELLDTENTRAFMHNIVSFDAEINRQEVMLQSFNPEAAPNSNILDKIVVFSALSTEQLTLWQQTCTDFIREKKSQTNITNIIKMMNENFSHLMKRQSTKAWKNFLNTLNGSQNNATKAVYICLLRLLASPLNNGSQAMTSTPKKRGRSFSFLATDDVFSPSKRSSNSTRLNTQDELVEQWAAELKQRILLPQNTTPQNQHPTQALEEINTPASSSLNIPLALFSLGRNEKSPTDKINGVRLD